MREGFSSIGSLQGQRWVNDNMQTSSRKLTYSRTLLQRCEYTSRNQLRMFWVAEYTPGLWCFKLHAGCGGRALTTTQHSSEFDAIMTTPAHIYNLTVPCQHIISRGNILETWSLHITAFVKIFINLADLPLCSCAKPHCHRASKMAVFGCFCANVA